MKKATPKKPKRKGKEIEWSDLSKDELEAMLEPDEIRAKIASGEVDPNIMDEEIMRSRKMNKLGRVLDESTGGLLRGHIAEADDDEDPKEESDAAPSSGGLDMKEMKDAVDAELTTFAKKLLVLVKTWGDDYGVEMNPDELADTAMMIVAGLKTKANLLKTAAKMVARRGDSMSRGLKKEL